AFFGGFVSWVQATLANSNATVAATVTRFMVISPFRMEPILFSNSHSPSFALSSATGSPVPICRSIARLVGHGSLPLFPLVVDLGAPVARVEPDHMDEIAGDRDSGKPRIFLRVRKPDVAAPDLLAIGRALGVHLVVAAAIAPPGFSRSGFFAGVLSVRRTGGPAGWRRRGCGPA